MDGRRSPFTGRRAALRALRAAGRPVPNGIDFVDVITDRDGPALRLTLLFPVAGPAPARESARIEGGSRVHGLRVTAIAAAPEDPRGLIVRLDRPGDFSTYTLVLSGPDGRALPGMDPCLSQVDFSFQVDSPALPDCRPPAPPAAPVPTPPPIDYLTRDFNSFRQLMLDRLSVVLPDFGERSPADVWVMLAELLSSRADYLAYYQDAVATEAYLDTARSRVSVRRHGRLLDYPLHEGQAARAFVCFTAVPADGDATLDGVTVPAGTPLLTRLNAEALGRSLRQPTAAALLEANRGAQVFETLHDVVLRAAHDQIRLHTWGEARLCLPKSATSATLRDDGPQPLALAAGDVLVLCEVRSPDTLREGEADPARRHAVRVVATTPMEDPLGEQGPVRLLQVTWHPEDALPFPLQLVSQGGQDSVVAFGNTALCDHGCTVHEGAGGLPGVPLIPPSAPDAGVFRPRLRHRGLVHAAPYDHVQAVSRSVATTLDNDPHRAVPQIGVLEGRGGLRYHPCRDLLASVRGGLDFVVEAEEDGRAFLRFGDGEQGRAPESGAPLRAIYRISGVGGLGAGNLARDEIAHVLPYAARRVAAAPGVRLLSPLDCARLAVRNPLPAAGGVAPEPIAQARRSAPDALKVQLRAVTAEDYADRATDHPEVVRAVATLRWTGSYHTVFLTIDRHGGRPVDPDFKARLLAWLEPFRLAGHELELDGPRYVPLDLGLRVRVAPEHWAGDVLKALRAAFSNADLPDGGQGFFHPDRLTFGQPVYLSEIVGRAMQLPGVAEVRVERFQRFGRPEQGELAAGVLSCHRLEIARLDGDPSAPENGRIDFVMEGGR